MKTYKAYVTDRYDGTKRVIESEYPNKKMFLEDLRGNGYTCANYYCKEAKVFDWVWSEREKYDFEEDLYALWRFTKIPKNKEEYKAMMEKCKKQCINDYARSYARNKSKQFERELQSEYESRQ